MSRQVEQRRSQRMRLEIAIRVIGFSLGKDHFSEDTNTVVVNREGALIKLKHTVIPKSEVRIINLANYMEADFHVVGPTHLESGEGTEWGVEYVEKGRNIWGIDFPPPLSSEEVEGALLECRVCHKQDLRSLSLMEAEALNSTGILAAFCDNCKKLTYWNYADKNLRPLEPPPPDLVAPPAEIKQVEKGIEKRKYKRMGMKLPILVRNAQGQEEITKSDDISKGGVAVSLSMDLAMGDQVIINCPYERQGLNFDRKAEVRRRAAFTFNDKRLYGFGYLS